MDKGLLTNNVFIDLLGINSLDHATVLQKLKYYRFHGKFQNWLESYLTNRRRQCYVNGVSSDREYMLCYSTGINLRSLTILKFRQQFSQLPAAYYPAYVCR